MPISTPPIKVPYNILGRVEGEHRHQLTYFSFKVENGLKSAGKWEA
jgi:hypothetical protein